MKQFFNNPGLIHIGEMIFKQLNSKSLGFCSNVCLDWKKLVDNNLRFWLNICVKSAPKLNEINKFYKTIHFDASNILINQWKQLILEAKTEDEYEKITNLLKKMHSDEIQKSFRPPIYMALLVEDLPLIRHLLLTYKNNFLANEKSKTKSFYDVAKSSMDPNIIEYLVYELQHKRELSFPIRETFYAPIHLRPTMKTNQELQKFLKFMLEYIVANFPDENETHNYSGRYNFLYFLYAGLGSASWVPKKIDSSKNAHEFLHDLFKTEKFKYGIHSYLLCDDHITYIYIDS